MPPRDYSHLKSLMVLKGVNQQGLALATHMSETTFSLKINGKGVFKQTELQAIVETLEIDPTEIGKYFFAPIV